MLKKIILFVFLFVLTSCAVFRGGNIKPVDLPTIEEAEKPSVSYSIVSMQEFMGKSKAGKIAKNLLEGELLDILRDSNYFGRISVNDPDADIKMDVTITNEANPAAMIPAIITGYSLYLIPSWATDKFRVEAKVEGKGISKKYELSDSTILVQWLPMIFLYPFHNMSKIPEVRKNIYKAILAEMRNDKVFN